MRPAAGGALVPTLVIQAPGSARAVRGLCHDDIGRQEVCEPTPLLVASHSFTDLMVWASDDADALR